MNGPTVSRYGIFDLQVCVPEHFTDKQTTEFANGAYPCGTRAGWLIRKQGDPCLRGKPERVPCSERCGFVHIMLDS